MVPFLGTEALAAGQVSRRALARDFTALYRNVYLPAEHQLTACDRAYGAWLWANRSATLVGLSAAATLGSKWIDADLPAELNRKNGKPVEGILIQRDELADEEVCRIRGLACTTPARTAYDLGRREGLITAIIRLDALAHATRVTPAQVEAVASTHPGTRGSRQLRNALDLMDAGGHSPQETRTRLVLIDAGVPRPATQFRVYDETGRFVARVDLAWVGAKVAVEYDGIQHWDDPEQRELDIDRIAELERLGWRVIRVSARMLRLRPAVIVERVVRALIAADFQFPEWPLVPRNLPLRVR